MSERAEITAPHRAEVAALCARIDALNGLCAHLRIGKHPSETFWRKFDKTKKAEESIRERHGL